MQTRDAKENVCARWDFNLLRTVYCYVDFDHAASIKEFDLCLAPPGGKPSCGVVPEPQEAGDKEERVGVGDMEPDGGEKDDRQYDVGEVKDRKVG